ncbi:triose-phosphate transporter family-domain-containing protein [Syncephalis fuscata]|nr:triose-phosphate transporter family-domain-containing protein [Syncephalis fuscata]
MSAHNSSDEPTVIFVEGSEDIGLNDKTRKQVRFASSVPDAEEVVEEHELLVKGQLDKLSGSMAGDNNSSSKQMAEQYWTTASIVLNISSSVGIVLVNKLVFESYKFKFGTFVTVIHFCCTWIGLIICARLGAFEPRPQLIFYQKTLTRPITISLAVICIGVCIASVTDVQMNLVGTFFAIAGVVVTSFYQVWIGSEQKALGLSPPQLLYRQAPMSVVMLLPCVFILDDVHALLNYEMTLGALFTILLSGVLAFLVNWSIFAIIGRTSAITYNVVGHAKLCLILVGGFLLFKYELDWRNLSGISVALFGIYLYSKAKMAESASASAIISGSNKERP